MATHTYTVTPPALNDGTGVVLSAGGAAPGGGAAFALVIDDTNVTSKRQMLNLLDELQVAITKDTWPPSL